MNVALARRPVDSLHALYSFILVALIALAFAMQATFLWGLAAGGGPARARTELVGQPALVPCANG